MSHPYIIPDPKLGQLIQQDLERFAGEWRTNKTIGSPEPIDAFCDVLTRGGKRLRGMLAMQSYYAHGGQSEAVALGAARVFELIQTSLLVVDDIADRSLLRRGGPSAHMRIKAYARSHYMKVDPLHYGQVQAMNVAYAGLHQATIELLSLPINHETARRACKRFHENICTTINGQIDDIYNEATRNQVTEADIELVMKRKTAYYTIVSPLELGACLAGVAEIPASLREYAVHTGCAFQITDDIMSTFGKEGDMGKGSNDDIREGKVTFMVHYALAHGSNEQRIQLAAILGRGSATHGQCDQAREIIKATGGLDYARERARFHETEALTALKRDETTDPLFKAYLETLTDYVVNRHS